MPRRTKKQYQHTKHQHVDTDDGWTHVIRGPSINTAALNDKAEAAAAVQKFISERKFTSLGEMEAEYEKHKKTLLDHPVMKRFLDCLDTDLKSHPNVECSHVVCLALGRFDNTDSSMKQLIFLEGVVRLLQRRRRITEPVFVYFQDPAFTTMDTVFLTSLGYHVIPPAPNGRSETRHSPSDGEQYLDTNKQTGSDGIACASTHFSETMLLYAPHLDFDITFEAAVRGRPAICMSNNMSDVVASHVSNLRSRERSQAAQGETSQVSIEAEEARGRSFLDSYDWQPDVDIAGDDFHWYNSTGIGLKKVPVDWKIDSNTRDAEVVK